MVVPPNITCSSTSSSFFFFDNSQYYVSIKKIANIMFRRSQKYFHATLDLLMYVIARMHNGHRNWMEEVLLHPIGV